MKYEICSKRDFDNGMVLTVRFPKSDLDEKSLYTVLNDTPDFLVPLNYKVIDDRIECVYHVGNLMKAKLFFGTKDKKGSIEQWNTVFKPLTECKDWFMSPLDFVFSVDYLFTDKNQRTFKYVYVPVKSEQSSYDDLKTMVKEISVQNPVNDAAFENIVLKAFMGDFTPSSFLNAINKHSDTAKTPAPRAPQNPTIAPRPTVQPQHTVAQESLPKNPISPESQPKINSQPIKSAAAASKPAPRTLNDDIIINMDGTTNAPPMPKDKKKKEKTKGGGLFGGRGKKTASDKSRMYGAAAEMAEVSVKPEPPASRITPVQSNNVHQEERFLGRQDDSVTRIGTPEMSGPYLSYIGNKPNMPQRIEVNVSEYGRFSIGRFDVTLNKRQSDYEFEASTKGVSRRHAIIEQNGGAYTLTDLQSAAGTFINGVKLGINESAVLSDGDRVSFGYDGADYIWRG